MITDNIKETIVDPPVFTMPLVCTFPGRQSGSMCLGKPQLRQGLAKFYFHAKAIDFGHSQRCWRHLPLGAFAEPSSFESYPDNVRPKGLGGISCRWAGTTHCQK